MVESGVKHHKPHYLIARIYLMGLLIRKGNCSKCILSAEQHAFLQTVVLCILSAEQHAFLQTVVLLS